MTFASALPYINGVKHLGNLAGSLLPADVYARFLRLEGEDVLFICATDEHGTPAELSAADAGLSVKDYCDRMHHKQAEIYNQFGLSFDYFGRSSSPQNRAMTQHFYQKLNENGFLIERTVQQFYSIDDKRFLPDRYVIGTCPKCGYTAARGDQCEQCTSLLDPTELINPRSAVSGTTNLQVRGTKHLFLRLDALAEEIRVWVDNHQAVWPRLTSSISYKWLDEGLQERGITRDLDWGIPVPRPGFDGKVFYVWFDAPIEYISATVEWADEDAATRDWKSWWLDTSDVTYSQFLAKDNVPFHTVFWPGVVLGTRESWLMADQIKSFSWLTYYGGKFSTSSKRGVFLDQALGLRPADEWRYFLLAQSPESDDSSFTWEAFASAVNKDLVGAFGNFVSRILKLSEKEFGDEIPTGGVTTDSEDDLMEECSRVVGSYRSHLQRTEYRKAIQSLRELWSAGNAYIDKTAPWSLMKQDRDRAAVILRISINLVRLFAAAAWPVIPFASERVFDALGLSEDERRVELSQLVGLMDLQAGRKFAAPGHLFTRISDDNIAAWKQQFVGGGSI
ncbi:methionine--tRNA ligase [Alicyclobacillus curvatus]|nr:methionine--tRNA ligase [Alicyclobacillus curvatus]